MAIKDKRRRDSHVAAIKHTNVVLFMDESNCSIIRYQLKFKLDLL